MESWYVTAVLTGLVRIALDERSVITVDPEDSNLTIFTVAGDLDGHSIIAQSELGDILITLQSLERESSYYILTNFLLVRSNPYDLK